VVVDTSLRMSGLPSTFCIVCPGNSYPMPLYIIHTRSIHRLSVPYEDGSSPVFPFPSLFRDGGGIFVLGGGCLTPSSLNLSHCTSHTNNHFLSFAGNIPGRSEFILYFKCSNNFSFRSIRVFSSESKRFRCSEDIRYYQP
jgi:hypothetical protein